MYFAILILGFIFQMFNKKIFFWSFAILITLLASLRYGIGIDYFGYEYLYSLFNPNIIHEIQYGEATQEILFRLVGSFFKSLSLPYQSFLILFAIISNIYIAKICKRYSKNPSLSILLFFAFYYLTWTFSGIRQGLVIAVGLYYLLVCLEKNKTVKFLLIVIILSLIHISALALILLYFISRVNFKKNTLIFISIIAVIFSLIPTGPLLSRATWLPFYSRIYTYFDYEISFTLFEFQTIARLAFLFVIFFFYDYYQKESEIQKKIIDLYILSMIFYFGMQFSELIAARIAIFGKFLDIIIFANILYIFKKPINRLLYIFMIFILCFMYLYKETGEIKRAVNSDEFFAPYVHIYNKSNYEFESRYNLLIND